MADEYKFPIFLRTTMRQAATILANLSDDKLRELGEDDQGVLRRILDQLERACTETGLAARPVADIPSQAREAGEAVPFGMYVERDDGTTEFQRTGNVFQPTAYGYKVWVLYDRAAPSARTLSAEQLKALRQARENAQLDGNADLADALDSILSTPATAPTVQDSLMVAPAEGPSDAEQQQLLYRMLNAQRRTALEEAARLVEAVDIETVEGPYCKGEAAYELDQLAKAIRALQGKPEAEKGGDQ